MRFRFAFTTIELIVVLAIFAVVIASTLPFLGKFQQSETLDTIANDIVQTLRRAQNSAATGKRGTAWGVHFDHQSYTRFAGASYAGRLTGLDEVHTIPDAFRIGGATDIIFAPLTGGIEVDRAITLSGPEGTLAEISVNPAGGIFLSQP